MLRPSRLTLAFLAMLLTACSHASHDLTDHSIHSEDAPASETIILGNGEVNQIQLAGMTRNGPSLVISSVVAEVDSFLVFHPFANGAPVQTDYVGATFVAAGTQRDVGVRLDETPNDGTPFIIMLHADKTPTGHSSSAMG